MHASTRVDSYAARGNALGVRGARAWVKPLMQALSMQERAGCGCARKRAAEPPITHSWSWVAPLRGSGCKASLLLRGIAAKLIHRVCIVRGRIPRTVNE